MCIRVTGFCIRRVMIENAEVSPRLNDSAAGLAVSEPEKPIVKDIVDVPATQMGSAGRRMFSDDSNDHDAKLSARVEASLVEHISEQLKIGRDHIDVKGEFSEFGFDSVSLTEFGNTLNKKYDLDLSPTIFFEYPTVAKLSKYLVGSNQELMEERLFSEGEKENIAHCRSSIEGGFCEPNVPSTLVNLLDGLSRKQISVDEALNEMVI